MIPEGWKEGTIGDAFETGRGRVISRHEIEANPGEYPVFSSQSTNNGEFGRIASYDFDGEYITWTTDGANAGTVFYRRGRFNCTNVCGTLKSNNKFDINLQFMSYFLGTKTKQYVSYVGNPKLMNNIIQKIPILFPPLAEQKRIAEVLGGVDAAIEATKAIIEQTKKVKQGLLQTLLTRGIGHSKFKLSPLGEIPEAWSVVSVADVAGNEKHSIVDGPFGSNLKSEHYETHGIPVLQSGFVTSGTFKAGKYVYVSEALFKKQIRSKAVGDDILMAKIGAQAGRCAIIPSNHPVSIIAGNCLKINVNKKICSNQFLWHFLTYEYESSGLKKIKTETAQPAISLKNLRGLKIPLPPLTEQEKMVESFESVDNQLTAETSKLASLQQLKKGLMHDLLTGKVRVPIEQSSLQVEGKANASTIQKTVQPAFKRAVLAAEITHQLYQNSKFGSVKQEKILDLCERHLDLDEELDRTAYRHAAGPYDNKAKRSIEENFKKQKWFDVQRSDRKGVKYIPLEKCGQHKKYFDSYFGHISTGIQSIIDLLRDMDTERCEIVATLYASWNDFLLKGQTPDDETIVNDVLAWHPKKQEIAKERWLRALPWMRKKNLIPHGTGRKTIKVT